MQYGVFNCGASRGYDVKYDETINSILLKGCTMLPKYPSVMVFDCHIRLFCGQLQSVMNKLNSVLHALLTCT